jgi:excinuclease UvrABC nuclease subunit
MAKFEGYTDISLVLRAGIYLLCYKGQVVYVGKSKSMYSRIYTHRNQWNNVRRGKAKSPTWLPQAVKGILFDEVHVRHCSLEAMDGLEVEAIQRFQPKYNVQHKPVQRFNPFTKHPDLVINGIRIPLGPAIIPKGPPLLRRI